jgi:cystathionine beta-lyase/cystathionine gamma-synthase
MGIEAVEDLADDLRDALDRADAGLPRRAEI